MNKILIILILKCFKSQYITQCHGHKIKKFANSILRSKNTKCGSEISWTCREKVYICSCDKNLLNQKLPLDQTGWPQLTTQGRGSPLYGDTLGSTLMSKGGNSGTETLTVSTRVTGAGIKHTSVTHRQM